MRKTRRTFLKSLSGIAAAGAAGSSLALDPQEIQPRTGISRRSQTGRNAIEVREGRLHVETATLTAVIDNGLITSLRSKSSGEEFIGGQQPSERSALQLLYRRDEAVGIDENRYGSVLCRKLSDTRAEFIFHNWDGDGVCGISVDPESGDLIVAPSAYASRPGVRACRWTIHALRPDLELVAPLFQGVRLKLDDPLLRESRWAWPASWEAGFAILQSKAGGFWIHAQDSNYRYKALRTGTKSDPFALCFDTEAYGPVDSNLSAGGLEWRVNVFDGDWKIPAGQYRDWLWRAYGLDEAVRSRKAWVRDLRLALSWCPNDPEILTALAKRVKPSTVLLHFHNWRTDPYDENYPTFQAGDQARAFIARGAAMGFRVMPHFNSIDMDPTHPVYARVRDFQYRDIESGKVQGWSWVDGKVLGVPESNSARLEHRDKKVMVKIHPGLGTWRSILSQSILEAVTALSLETVFLDVTLNTFNLHNSLVDATTSSEGMKRLIDQVASLGPGLVVGGEGLNETTAQSLSLAQVHLFRSWQKSDNGLERTGGCPLGEFLLGRLCRSFGYSSLGGRNADEQLRMRIHEEHGAIPTITVRSAKEIANPNPAVERVLQAAGS